VEGPWGGDGGSFFCDGQVTGIKGWKISSSAKPAIIWSLPVKYDIWGQLFQSQVHGELDHAVEDMINFDYPDEYLQKIEGYYGQTSGIPVGNTYPKTITSISFKSNIKTYGPYGLSHGGETHFRSGIGKIMGFWGKSGMCLDQVGVL
ncbi:hypothetical protein CY35_03G110200, partial [Sphagnum magellanicum]